MPLYTVTATATGGRNGTVTGQDGLLNFEVSTPKSMGGPGKDGATNPEALFACGYSACFAGAIGFVAGQKKLTIEPPVVTASVSFDANDTGFFLAVDLKATIGGVDRATAEALVHEAHQVCPYSKATRNNIVVTVALA